MFKKTLIVLIPILSVLILFTERVRAQSVDQNSSGVIVSPEPIPHPIPSISTMPAQPATQSIDAPMTPSATPIQPETSTSATDIIKNIFLAPIQPQQSIQPAPTRAPSSVPPETPQPPSFTPAEQRGSQPSFENKGGFDNRENSGENQFRQNRNGEEDQKRQEEMEKRREEEQKKMDARRLADTKKGIKNMERGLTSMEKRMKTFEAKKVAIPQDMRDALEKAKSLIEQVKNANSTEEIDSLDLNDFGDYMQTINEGWQKLEMAAQFPKVLKQADKELARIKSVYAKAEIKSRGLKMDVSSLLSSWKTEIDKLSAARDKAKQLTDGGQAEEAIELMQDEFFGEMENVNENQRILEMLAGTQKMLKNANLQITSYGKKVAKLKKSGEDTAKLEDLLNQAKTKVAEIKQILATTPIDSDILTSTLRDLEDLKGDFNEELNSITGEGGMGGPRYDVPGLQNFRPIGIPKDFGNFIKKDQQQEKQNMEEQQNRLPPINQKPAEDKVSEAQSFAVQIQAQIGNLFNFLKSGK